MLAVLGVSQFMGHISWWYALPLWPLVLFVLAVFNFPALRIRYLSWPIFRWFKRQLPPMSQTEKEALEAGNTWWDADLFQGLPEWSAFLEAPFSEMTLKEKSFLDNQVETLCKLVDNWQVNRQDYDLSPEVWTYMKKEKFFGMTIPEAFGGLGFSEYAHSEVITKIGTASSVAAGNSDGP